MPVTRFALLAAVFVSASCSRATRFGESPTALPAHVAYHVSTDGSDGVSGLSPKHALRTVTAGLAKLRPGDTLLIYDGTYAEPGLAVSGLKATAEHPTVVKAVNRWGAKLEGVGREVVIFKIEDSEHVVVEGLEVYHPGETAEEDWSKGIESFTTDYLTVRDCYVHDCGCGGFSGRTGDYMLFENNVAVGNARFSPYNCSGFSIYHPHQRDDAPGPHIVLRDNVAFGNECRVPFSVAGFAVPTDGNGIILDDFENNQPDIDSVGSAAGMYTADVLLEGNLSFGNGGAGIKTYKVANATFRRNTAYHNNYVLAEYGGNLAEIGFEDVTGDMVAEGNIGVAEFALPTKAFVFKPRGTDAGEAATLRAEDNVFVGNVVVEGAELGDGNEVYGADYQSYVGFAEAGDTVRSFGSIEELRRRFALRPGSPAAGRGAVAVLSKAEAAGLAALPADPRPLAVFHSTPRGIKVDGVKDGWYTGPGHAIVPQAFSGQPDTDAGGRWWGAFTADSLYAYVELSADSAMRVHDVMFVFMKSRLDSVSPQSYWMAPSDDGLIDGVSRTFKWRSGGYDAEFAWAWDALQVHPDTVDYVSINVSYLESPIHHHGVDSLALANWARIPYTPYTDSTDALMIGPSWLADAVLRDVPPPLVLPYASAKPSFGAGAAPGSAPNASSPQPIATILNPNPRGAPDLGGQWRAAWTDEALYLHVEVTDDSLDVQRDEPWYNLDGLEVYLDADNSKTFNGYDRNDFHVSVTPSGELVVRQGQLAEGYQLTAATERTADGYVAEVTIPWAAIGLSTPTDGTFLGLDIHLTDDDDGGRRDSKLSWHATLDQAYQNAALFGTVVLGR